TCVSGGSITFSVLTPANSIADTSFHHLAVVAKNGAIEIYIDGVSQSLSSSGSFSTTFLARASRADKMIIGAIQRDTLRAEGAKVIDEVSIYNRPLTASEIQLLFASGSGGKCGTPLLLPRTLPDAVVGQPYSEPLSGANGKPGYAFAITAG